jgi:hypothetical protein
MGRAADPWRAAETWTQCLANHSVSLHVPRRGYPPTQTWRTFLRNQAFGIGTIGLGEAGRLSDKLLALVRDWIARVVRVTKMRDGFRCGLIEPSLTLHRCGHIALPIVLLGAALVVVACRALGRPPL